MPLRIVEERPDHYSAVDSLVRAAFSGDGEAGLINALRQQGSATLALVAEDQCGKVIGHIMFSRLAAEIGGTPVAAVALAPLAVAEGSRRSGVGSALVESGLIRCREQGVALALVLGDPRYYGRFGFSAEKARALDCVYSGPHLLAAEVMPGALGCGEGWLRYPPPFDRLA